MPRINYDDYSVFAQALADIAVPKILEKAELPDIPHEFSRKFEKRMNRLIRKEKKFYFPIIKTTARKAIAISAAVIIMLSVMCLSVSALRNTVSEFVSRIFIDEPEKSPESVNETSPTKNIHTLLPSETKKTDITTEFTAELQTAPVTADIPEITAACSSVSTEKTKDKTLITEFDDVTYSTNFKSIILEHSDSPYYYNYTDISDDKLEDKLNEGIIIGNDCDTGSKGTHTYKANGEVYSISGVNKKFAVAVRFADTGIFKVYRNISYIPETIGDLIDDCGLKSGINGGEVHNYSYTGRHMDKKEITEKTYNIDNDFILNVLLSDTGAEQTDHYSVTLTDHKAYINFNALGQNKCLLIGLNQSGYIWVNFSGSVFNYYIGQEKANEIIDCLNENYISEILVYDEN